ncbi:MAG: iron-containing alcohol dehydrogenase [Lachnospiraceae bacterium]|nr:iron-containing alcohol dehydrogenase [Lachnospiraceae bacterium]
MNSLQKIYCRVFQIMFKIVLPFFPYRTPEIVGSVKALPEIIRKNNCDNLLIITDTNIRKLGLTKRLENILTSNGINFIIYDRTVENPTTTNVVEALKIYQTSGCNAIVGFGGGSSMDCAKAVAVCVAKPGKSLENMKGILKVHTKLPMIIAIPTTAGTGSETTLTAVIVNAETRYKYVLHDFSMIPRCTVLDPRLTLSLSPYITAITGMDALTRAIEAFLGNSTAYDTQKSALLSVKLVFDNLDSAYENGNNRAARRNMLKASFYAGLAFTKSYVGYVQAVSLSLNGEYNISHGLVNAVLLPYILEAYGRSIYNKLHMLANEAGISDEHLSDQEAAQNFIQAIKDMKKRFGIEDRILEIKEEDISKLSHYADKEANPFYHAPVLMNAKDLEQFYYLLMKN